MEYTARGKTGNLECIGKEEDESTSETEEFISDFSSLEEIKSLKFYSPLEDQDDMKFEECTNSGINFIENRPNAKRCISDTLISVKYPIESSFTKANQHQDSKSSSKHLTKYVAPFNHDPDSNPGFSKECRNLMVSSLENHLKALVQDLVKQNIPSAEKYHEVAEKIRNILSFSKRLNNRTQSIPTVSFFEKNPKQSIPSKPLLLKYTEGINGTTKELLICTAETIVDVCQNNPSTHQTQIIRRLLEVSKTYSGKPLHIIFNPRKLSEGESTKLIRLHPSPGKHNLLSNIRRPERPAPSKNLRSTFTENKSKSALSSNMKSLESLLVSEDPYTRSPQNIETTSSEKKKLTIRLCRKKKSRTALKRIDVKQVVSSVFRNIFHFYALLGGHLKSGSVITRSGSNYWLKQAGVAEDEYSLETANNVFMAVAGSKVVLNIFDYLKFLILYARKRRITVTELVDQLIVCKPPQSPSYKKLNRKFMSRETIENCERKKMHVQEKHKWFRSLPNL